MTEYTAAQLNAAGREFMAVALCGIDPANERTREVFRHQWDLGGFQGQREAWTARARAVLDAAEAAKGEK